MTDFSKVLPGDALELPASTYNAMIDAARANQSSATVGPSPRPRSTGQTVLVKNSSGADVIQYGVLGIDSVVFTPTDDLQEFKNGWALDCSGPTAGTHEGVFVVCAEPIANGAIGRGWVNGTCVVQIDVLDAGHQFADITDGDDSQLTSATYGSARILYAEAGTGTKWAVVRLDNGALTEIRLGKPTEAYTTGPHATFTLDPCDAAGTDNGEANVTVQAGWTLPTVDDTALTIPVTAIIPFRLAADGKWYVLGQPVQDYGEVTYNTTSHKLFQTTWYEFGWFRTTISDPQEITTAVSCDVGDPIDGGTD